MEKILRRISNTLAQRQDVVLAFFVISVIFMMIVPLPTGLVDVLIGLNMCLSIVLLMVAVYLKSPTEFASFPAVLLISTLFRLSLSIATTRLILLDADAGHIVAAFGDFVVGGNLVVGLVIFLILTIVNFIVITKGTERVAEVGARFSLDAMPGRQLSIDADLRSGAITQAEAKALRGKVVQESRLLGSMDGAMKFVKGDAISSIIIVFVNLLGGLAVGIFQKGMSAGDALNVYAVLSIGDGLVAQIPALFISICAGIIVTRVADESSDTNLANDIGVQIMREPKALTIGAVTLFIFAWIPGFPTLTFLVMSAIFAIPALMVFLAARKRKKHGENRPLDETEGPITSALAKDGFAIEEDEIYSPTTQLLVELAPNLESELAVANLRAEINKARLQIYFRLGINLPPVDVRKSASLAPNQYRIFVQEIPSAEGIVVPNSVFVLDDTKNLDLFKIPYTKNPEMVPRMPAIWVEKQYESKLKEASVRYKTEVEAIAYHAEFIFAKYVANFVGIQETKQILTRMEEKFPDLVKEAQRVLQLQQMTDLFKRLVQEFVSIRDVRTILSAMIEWGAKEKDPVVLVEHIRIALSRQISYQYSSKNNIVAGIILDAQIEETIRNSIRQTAAGTYMSLEPEVSKQLISLIREKAVPILSNTTPCCLVAAMDVRRFVRRMIEAELPELPVLSYQELASDVTLQPVARVAV